jgi:hypothetical protein
MGYGHAPVIPATVEGASHGPIGARLAVAYHAVLAEQKQSTRTPERARKSDNAWQRNARRCWRVGLGQPDEPVLGQVLTHVNTDRLLRSS